MEWLMVEKFLAACWAFLKRIPWQAWAALALVALLAWHIHGDRKTELELTEVRAQYAAYQAKMIAATEAAKRAAHAHQDHDRAAFAKVAADYQEDKADAVRKERAVADDLRRGALRLRKEWRCPASGGAGVAGAAEGADDAAELRATLAGAVVRVGAEADAQVKGLQSLLKAEREKPLYP